MINDRIFLTNMMIFIMGIRKKVEEQENEEIINDIIDHCYDTFALQLAETAAMKVVLQIMERVLN